MINIKNGQEHPYLALKRQPHKMVKHNQTIRRLLPTNCLSAFDHFEGLASKGLGLQFKLVLLFFDFASPTALV